MAALNRRSGRREHVFLHQRNYSLDKIVIVNRHGKPNTNCSTGTPASIKVCLQDRNQR